MKKIPPFGWIISVESKMKNVLPYIFYCEEENRIENAKSMEDLYLTVH